MIEVDAHLKCGGQGGREVHYHPREAVTGQLVYAENELRDDSEVARAPAQTPQQLAILTLVGHHQFSRGQHHLSLEQVINTKTVFSS